MSDLNVTTVIVQILILGGVIYTAWLQHHRTPAQKDKDVLGNMQDLINQYRISNADLQKEVDRLEGEMQERDAKHAATISNFEAVMQKRDIDCREEAMRLKKDRDAYAIAYTGIRRIAIKYVPSDVVLPEVNGNTKDLK